MNYFSRGPAAGGAFDFDHGKLGLNAPVESYRVAHRLTDHNSDVAGLEWSPDGRWLASCGLDSHILIWDVTTGFKLSARLEGHKGFVKGLAWDPLGIYLASQSDDHSLIIWRTRDWQMETSLKKPFDQANEETFFRRASWTPDGSFIAAANAVNGRQPAVALISRDQWKPEIAFIGHLLAVEVARFSPFFYRRSPNEIGYLCAAGSQDCNTSIWTDKNSKPLAVLTDLFEHAVMDIEWLPDGLSMIVAAYDGTIAKIIMRPDFVGAPLVGKERSEYLESLEKAKNSVKIDQLPCTVGLIKLHDKLETAKAEIMEEQRNRMTDSQVTTQLPDVVMQDANPVESAFPAPSARPIQSMSPVKQIETKTKEGKRRIVPMLVQTENSAKPSAQSLPQANTPISTPAQSNGFTIKTSSAPTIRSQTLPKRLFAEPRPGHVIEVLNNKASAGLPAETKIRVSIENNLIWEDKLESHVTHLANDPISDYIALAFQNKSIVIMSMIGRRLTPPLLMDGTIVALTCQGRLCLSITEFGTFHLWDLTRVHIIVSGNLSAIIRPCPIASAEILGYDCFRVSYQDGSVYQYLPGFGTFVQTNDIMCNPLEYEIATTDSLDFLKKVLQTDINDARSNTIASLESRLSLAALEGNMAAFHIATGTYVRRLIAEGLWNRLREFLLSLAKGEMLSMADVNLVICDLLDSIRALLVGVPNASSILEELELFL